MGGQQRRGVGSSAPHMTIWEARRHSCLSAQQMALSALSLTRCRAEWVKLRTMWR